VCVSTARSAYAALGDPSSASTSYKVIEGEIGGNGQFNSSSTNYNINPKTDDGGSSLGESAVGNSASTNYQTNSGFDTTAQPALSIVVNTTSVSLGTLSTGAANTATATFNVRDYTAYGYAVTIIGNAPSNSGHPLAGMGTQSANSTGCVPSCASANGVEQFGINLRLNSSPTTVGADPVPVPSSSFAQSTPSVVLPLPYRTANQYRYFNGDTIASVSSVANVMGETGYTMSFLANSSPTTPGGTYAGNISIVATGTF
jgi:hypothetical protein